MNLNELVTPMQSLTIKSGSQSSSPIIMNSNELVTSMESLTIESGTQFSPIMNMSDVTEPPTIQSGPSPTNAASQASRPSQISKFKAEFRKVSVPDHRLAALKELWRDLYLPVFHLMKIDLRMNFKTNHVQFRTRPDTPHVINLYRSASFVYAFMLGFDTRDTISMLRHRQINLQSFEITSQSRSTRGSLSAINVQTKRGIESSTGTRILIADTKIHILGSSATIIVAMDSLCKLIHGVVFGREGIRSRYRSYS